MIRILPNQIATPKIWNIIKFVSTETNEIQGKDIQRYCNDLLRKLLNNKMQCFFCLSDERKIRTVILTEMQADNIRQIKLLFVRCIYTFEVMTDNNRHDIFKSVHEFAKKTGCSIISLVAGNKQMCDFAKECNFRETKRIFEVKTGIS
ncbi:MAG: hypothetical protein DRH04_08120 [Deltaproteobacteria bacterium]|nr:MAG: hypothetical protein DRH04_08120 [Deltaproteobacteria bacterium]